MIVNLTNLYVKGCFGAPGLGAIVGADAPGLVVVFVNGPLGCSNGVSGVNGRDDPFFLSLSTPFLATPADNKTYTRYYISLRPDRYFTLH